MALMSVAPAAGFRRQMNRGPPRSLPRAFLDEMRSNMDAGTRRAILRLYRATPAPAADAEQLHQGLRPLDRPALVIWGRHDPFIPAAHAQRQWETFPGAAVHVLEDSGHWPFAADPARVEPLVTDFLRSVCRASAQVDGSAARPGSARPLPASAP